MEDLSARPQLYPFWNAIGRCLVFSLAFSSIASLLVEFYGVVSMRIFTLFAFLPSLLLISASVIMDIRWGDRQLARSVINGTIAGFLAAVAYDIFRLPFVFSHVWSLDGVLPALPLFKVFPRFGAMILGEPVEQTAYSFRAQFIGWSYHFSNGATFGVLYLAVIGTPRRRSWLWAILMAVGLELGMLLTPYPAYFHIRISWAFITVTLSAHLVFGVVLGLVSKFLDYRVQWPLRPTSAP